MIEISKLLQRATQLFIKESGKLPLISKIIKEEIGIDVPIASISIKDKKIRISADPVARSYIFLRKEKLLKRIKEEGSINIEEIY
jgi:PP-loop superfamily ATP-utilizing enzyme